MADRVPHVYHSIVPSKMVIIQEGSQQFPARTSPPPPPPERRYQPRWVEWAFLELMQLRGRKMIELFMYGECSGASGR